MLLKLLKRKTSLKQLIGFTLANLVGLTIIFLGFQLYRDIKPILTGEDSFINDEYIVLSKEVSTLTSIIGQDKGFTAQEIENIKEESTINKVGEFTASLFDINASISFVGKNFGISTDLFFESVPNDFIDIDLTNWHFDEAKEEIPIIIPRSYLDLYNFGFASSKNLPKVSEELINNITLSLRLKGNQKQEVYNGRIVGFSKRLNTILVPEEFLKEANKQYAPGKTSKTNRAIIEVSNASDPKLAQFIKENNYNIDGNQLDGSKANYLLKIALTAVSIVGLLISVLASYLLILSIFLLLEKNITTLENLSLIGYSNTRIRRPYIVTVGLLNLASIFGAFVLTQLAKYYYAPHIANLSSTTISRGLNVSTYVLGVILLSLIITISVFIIRRKISSITTFKK